MKEGDSRTYEERRAVGIAAEELSEGARKRIAEWVMAGRWDDDEKDEGPTVAEVQEITRFLLALWPEGVMVPGTSPADLGDGDEDGPVAGEDTENDERG